MNVQTFCERKKAKQKIAMLTCYDYTSARILNETSVDALLVGDSAAMVMLGHPTTLPISTEQLAQMVTAVVRGAPKKFVVSDLPFLSNRKSLDQNMYAVELLMKAGAHAVKVEGLVGNEEFIRHTVTSGVPVMGHLGLTPQSIHMLGGYSIQGRSTTAATALVESSLKMEELGCFSLVLECVPFTLAEKISQTISIPTIGIGAGPNTDGQILVFQDMLGLNTDFKPKFLRKYLNGSHLIAESVDKYVSDVQNQSFPSLEESYE